MKAFFIFTFLAILSLGVHAQELLPAITSTSNADGGITYSLTIETLLFLTALTFIPPALLLMTSHHRFVAHAQCAGHANHAAHTNFVGAGVVFNFFCDGAHF